MLIRYSATEELDHFLDKSVNVVTLITDCSVFAKMDQLLLSAVSFSWGVQFEWPQEIGGFLEIRTSSKDLMNEVFHANNILATNNFLNDGVGAEGNSLTIDFTKSALVYQLSNRFKVRSTVSNKWLDKSKHLSGGSIETNEDAIVDLAKTEQTQDLLHFGGNTNDTTNSDNKDNFIFFRDVELISCLGLTTVVNGDSLKLISMNK